MTATKRMRGIAIHRPILVGSTATPLTPEEKLTAPPDHTHKWTIAVRSAASHPLPTVPDFFGPSTAAAAPPPPPEATASSSRSTSANANAKVPHPPAHPPDTDPAATTNTEGGGSGGGGSGGASGVSTRGRDVETDYHKMVGGRDDISHFIKRVQFKLHESFAQPTRNIDRPPYQVCETGWGEFDIQVKIFFVPESGEKPLSLVHRLKLHPWHPVALRSEAAVAAAPTTQPTAATAAAADGSGHGEREDGEETKREKLEGETTGTHGPDGGSGTNNGDVATTTTTTTNGAAPGAGDAAAVADPAPPPVPLLPPPPPVVHSWAYDEVVFPEPTEAMYEILTAHPPTPLPLRSSDALLDGGVGGGGGRGLLRAYRCEVSRLSESLGMAPDEWSWMRNEAYARGVAPPHPLHHNPTGSVLESISVEAVEDEADRLERLRVEAVRELDRQRERLIEGERRLREGKRKLDALLAQAKAVEA